MNKTVTINISGIIFHIEEDAYERLQVYLSNIRNRFSAEDGRDEIMMDIESRIAEILNERVGPSKQVVVMADVDHVIALMGEPEAITDNEEKTEEQKSDNASQEESYRRKRRRLYRDPDDKVVGGVCSGLGYYFDIDPVWIRIGFAVIFLLFGTGFLFYLLLMIIVPKAETTAEKLEMRGEPVDVNNISKTIKEEFEGFRRRVEDFGEDAKRYGKKWKEKGEKIHEEHTRKWRRSGRRRTDAEMLFHDFFRGVLKLFGIAMIFVGILVLISLLTFMFSISDLGPGFLNESFHNLFSDSFHHGVAVTAILLIIGIPLLMMIYQGFRILFRITRANRIVTISAFGLWLCGVGLGCYAGVNIAKGFSEESSVRETIAVAHTDTLYLRVNIDKDMVNPNYHSRWNRRYHYERHWKAVSIHGEELKLGYPDLNIVESDNDSIELVIFKSAHGTDRREALANAKGVKYTISVHDSLIVFNNYFTLSDKTKWRAQEVHAELRIPKNTVVYFHPTICDVLYDITNTSNTLDEDMGDRRWKMTDKGLACIDCAGLDLERKENDFPQPGVDDYLPGTKNDTIILRH